MTRPASAPAVVISCEHAGNEVPHELRPLFAGHEDLLASHRGWDPGALVLAEVLARRLDAPLFASRLSRLVVDLNRSPHHRQCFSGLTRRLPRAARLELLERYYLPHRRRVEEAIARSAGDGRRVLHVAVHTFTPVLDGEVRRVDLGLLYDPRRESERSFCRRLGGELHRRLPDLRVRFNNPYRGRADGFTTALRRCFPGTLYLGIELEVSQRLLHEDGESWKRVLDELPAAVAGLLV